MLESILETSRYGDHLSLSPLAKKLADAVKAKKSVAAALKDDPSLMGALDEYTEWCHEQGRMIGSKSSNKPLSHESALALKKLKLKRKK